MNNDDVIPPSPQVKLIKSRTRRRSYDASRKKKKRHSILSLRMKNLQVEKSNAENASSSIISPSTSDETGKEIDNSEHEIDIYAGIDDESIEEKNRTMLALDNFDMLSQPKLIEQCNQYDMSLAPKVKLPIQFSQSHGLVSIKELLASERQPFANNLEAQKILSSTQKIRVEKEAEDVSMENIQFSEWPLPDDRLNPKTTCNNQSALSSSAPEQPVSSLSHQIVKDSSDASLIVQNIMNDFDDDDSPSQENIQNTPPLVLVRRQNKKTYNRTEIAPLKTLVFDESNGDDENDMDNVGDIESTQYTQDIDLNASRHIVENLSRLNSFFTQPQSFVLDFNADLSQTITLDEEFREFDDYSDDFQNIDISENFEDLDVTNEETSNADSPSINLLSQENDIFMNITTPKMISRCRNIGAVAMVSTPLSSKKGHIEDPTMHSTPPTSKTDIPVEQFVPKRLRFGTEMEETGNKVDFKTMDSFKPSSFKLPGFSTGSGKSIQISAKSMKRTAAIFAKIDEECSDIDVNFEEASVPKRAKNSYTATAGSSSRFSEDFSKKTLNLDGFSDFTSSFKPLNVPSSTSVNVGFATARGSTINVKASNVNRYAKTLEEIEQNLCNEFGECKTPMNSKKLNASKEIQSTSGLSTIKLEPIAGSSNICVGFATARGSNITVSSKNVDKFAQHFKEVDQKVREDFEFNENANLNSSFLECKTPLNRLNHRSKPFMTSTPNPNAVSAFKSCPPITPINNQTAELVDFTHWKKSELDDLFDTNTQQFASKSNTSLNLNDTITNDFQLLDESVTDVNCDVLQIHEEIKFEREKALNLQQADCLKKPHPIRPNCGFLLVQKLLGTKKFNDLGKPKKYQRKDLEQFGIEPNIIELTADNVMQFKFNMWKFYSDEICRTNIDGINMQDGMVIIMDGNSRVGFKELTSAFLQCPSVDPKLVPDHWIKNGLKLIIVKLASYERSYPHEFAGKCLTPENTLAQLKYRYDREIDKVQRSVIRKMVEKDDTAAKRIILYVTRILKNSSACSLELSDGWYSIKTSCLDLVLTSAVSMGKIAIGTKLVIQGAEIEGFEEACHPLDMPGSVALKITANSTRRARWYAKLGYCKESWPFAISLNSVEENGGLITRMKAYVLRVYPTIYAVKENLENGPKTVYRSNKIEQRENKKNDKKQFDLYEKFYGEVSDQVEKEYEKERKKIKRTTKKICDIDDGEELWNLLDLSNDGIECLDLSSSQRKMLDDYSVKFNDKKQNKINQMVRDKINEIGTSTQATPVQKIRLIDTNSPNILKTAILSIWRPNESHDILRENTVLDIYNVTASKWGKDLTLSTGTFTKFREVQPKFIGSERTTLHADFIRKLIPLAEIEVQKFKPHFNEFDTFGYVFHIEDAPPFQLVYIVDALINILCIKFWGNTQQYAYDDIVQINKFLVISQLEWRPQNRFHRNGLPQAFVNEMTIFTENPKSAERTTAIAKLREKFNTMNLNEYIKACNEKLGEITQTNKENTSANTSKSFETSMNRTMFSRTAPSPAPLVEPVLKKTDQLKQYGSPPVFRGSYLGKKETPNSSRKPFKNPSRAQQSTDKKT